MGGEFLNYCSSTIDDQTAARSHAMSEPAAAAIIMGSETELVRIRGAQLCLIDGEESVLMQKGDFCLRLLKQEHSPLAAIVAAVGEVQWPVGKDAPVLKVWNRRYTFALPGLVYGLIFPAETTPLEVLQQLEAVMDRYCTFEVHREIAIAGKQTIHLAGCIRVNPLVMYADLECLKQFFSCWLLYAGCEHKKFSEKAIGADLVLKPTSGFVGCDRSSAAAAAAFRDQWRRWWRGESRYERRVLDSSGARCGNNQCKDCTANL